MNSNNNTIMQKFTSNNINLTQRESNFELMRICAMVLIVWHHLCQHGIWLPANIGLTFNSFIGKGLFNWTGSVGNWLFILLSGYFVSSSQFSFRRFFKTWLQIFSTSIIIGLLFFICKISLVNANVDLFGFYLSNQNKYIYEIDFSVINLLKSLLPNFFANNWFATTYLIFYLFTPILNESLKALKQRNHKYLILLMTVLGNIIYMIPGQKAFQPNNLFNFILGYYIASYIRIYNPITLQNQKRNLLLSFFAGAIFILWIALVLKYRNIITFIDSHFIQVFNYPLAMNRLPSLLNAIFLFCFFKNLKISYNKWINKIGGTTFGIYLIHENTFLNNVIWHKIFKIDNFLESNFLIFYMIFIVLIVFLSCSIIELIRKLIIEKPIMFCFDNLVSRYK